MFDPDCRPCHRGPLLSKSEHLTQAGEEQCQARQGGGQRPRRTGSGGQSRGCRRDQLRDLDGVMGPMRVRCDYSGCTSQADPGRRPAGDLCSPIYRQTARSVPSAGCYVESIKARRGQRVCLPANQRETDVDANPVRGGRCRTTSVPRSSATSSQGPLAERRQFAVAPTFAGP